MRRTNTSIELGISALLLLALGCGADAVSELERDGKAEDEGALGTASRALGSSPAVISAAERSRMQSYLEDRSRFAVHSEYTESGSLIECIPIEKQFSLRRAEMAGHKLAQRPAAQPTVRSDPNFPETEAFTDGGHICPEGTISQLGITMEDLERAGSLDAFFNKGLQPVEMVPGTGPDGASHWYATADLFGSTQGGRAVLNIWSPYTDIGDMSLSQLWAVRGSGSDLQTVEAGWQRYPDKYGDTKPRLFIYYTSDNYNNTGCYNLDCGSFVQMDNTVVIGGWLNASITNGTQHVISIGLDRQTDGNWWVKVGSVWVGYYPSSLFDSAGLGPRASKLSFGGEAGAFTSQPHVDTNIGSGAFPSAGWQKAAYTRTAEYKISFNNYAPASSWVENAAEPLCYDIATATDTGAWGEYFYFGGDGRIGTVCP